MVEQVRHHIAHADRVDAHVLLDRLGITVGACMQRHTPTTEGLVPQPGQAVVGATL
jgi:hypothetical protein